MRTIACFLGVWTITSIGCSCTSAIDAGCEDGNRRDCYCSGGLLGEQTCTDGEWGQCEDCSSELDTTTDGDIIDDSGSATCDPADRVCIDNALGNEEGPIFIDCSVSYSSYQSAVEARYDGLSGLLGVLETMAIDSGSFLSVERTSTGDALQITTTDHDVIYFTGDDSIIVASHCPTLNMGVIRRLDLILKDAIEMILDADAGSDWDAAIDAWCVPQSYYATQEFVYQKAIIDLWADDDGIIDVPFASMKSSALVYCGYTGYVPDDWSFDGSLVIDVYDPTEELHYKVTNLGISPGSHSYLRRHAYTPVGYNHVWFVIDAFGDPSGTSQLSVTSNDNGTYANVLSRSIESLSIPN